MLVETDTATNDKTISERRVILPPGAAMPSCQAGLRSSTRIQRQKQIAVSAIAVGSRMLTMSATVYRASACRRV